MVTNEWTEGRVDAASAGMEAADVAVPFEPEIRSAERTQHSDAVDAIDAASGAAANDAAPFLSRWMDSGRCGIR